MKMKQVLLRCQEAGHPMTAMGVYTAGEKYGFIIKQEGKRSLYFDRERFLAWLEKAKEEVPDGFITVLECAKRVNMSVGSIYLLIKDNKSIQTKNIGSGKGILYVNFNQLEKFISERKYGTEEEFGN